MLGFVEYRDPDSQEPKVRALGGARFRAAYVCRGEGLRARLSAVSASRALAREGVRCAVFPPEYPHLEAFARRGVLPPPLTPLYHATAAALVREYLTRRGMDARCTTLAFAARESSPELRRAIWALCADARHIALCFPGAEETARALRRELGVAARVVQRRELPNAGMTVCFDPCAAPGRTLPLYAPLLSVEYDAAYPNEVLAALLLAGALDASALRVRRVEQNTI